MKHTLIKQIISPLLLLMPLALLHAAEVRNLRCEYRENPLGVDSPRPALSWITSEKSAGVRSQRQTAYQVLVASTPELLANGKGDLWDSGKVSSDQSLQVEYAGRSLESRQQCFWKVRVWDKEGAAMAWSAPATWSMGLLTPQAWKAKWIGAVARYDEYTGRGAYLSADSASADEEKWVRVDLGSSRAIDRVVLHSNCRLPVAETVKGFGFPVRFLIEASDDPDFKSVKVITDQTAADYPNPGYAAVGFDAGGVTARYVRVRATKLWSRVAGQGPYLFSLSQLEIVSADKNVALHTEVAAKDSIEQKGWCMAALTDGKRLAPLPGTQPNDNQAGRVQPKPSETIQLRKEFTLDKEIKRAVVYVCGLGQFELRLNGKKVGDAVLEPGWTDYRKTCLYSTYDITRQLARGANAIGVMLGNGMYNVPGGRHFKFTGSYGPTKVILQLHVEYADGTSAVVGTDNSWSWALSPIVFSCTFGGEDYDARRETPGWDAPGFQQDAAWRSAVEMPGPLGKLVGTSSSAPPIKVQKTFDSAPAVSLEEGVWLYDLRQNSSILPRITVQGPAGSKVNIETGERWEEGKFVGNSDKCVSYNYTLRGDGKPETWQPRFTYVGARYLRVTCSPAEKGGERPKILKVQGDFMTSSSAEAGSFECSSELFNGIVRIIRWSMRSNMMSILTDCPHREKLGWQEEVYLVGPSLIYSYDLQCLLRKITGDLADAQLSDGLVPDIAPEYMVLPGLFRDAPEWGSSAVITPWNIYRYYGDTDLLRQRYETMARYTAWLERRAKDDIQPRGLMDWAPLVTCRVETTTSVYFEDLKIMENAAKVLGKEADAQRYAAKAESVRQAYNKLLFSGSSYGSQADNAKPLALGITEPNDRPAALQSLIADIRKRGNAISTGEVSYPYLLRALAQNGRSDVIYDMTSGTDKPGYGMILAKGNTTLTEAWDGSPRSSSNHFMFGHIMEWFYGYLAGIKPGTPGFKQIVIKPQPVGDLTWVKAHYDSPYGRIVSNWKREKSRLNMEVTIPANTTAEVFVPAKEANTVTESGKPADKAKGVKFLRMQDGAAVYAVGSGIYRFETAIP